MNDFDNSNDGVEGSQTFVKLSENNETGGGAADVPNSLDDGFWKEQVDPEAVANSRPSLAASHRSLSKAISKTSIKLQSNNTNSNRSSKRNLFMGEEEPQPKKTGANIFKPPMASSSSRDNSYGEISAQPPRVSSQASLGKTFSIKNNKTSQQQQDNSRDTVSEFETPIGARQDEGQMEERPAPKASTLNRKGELLNRQSSTLKKKQQEQAMRDSVSDFEKPIPMEEEHSGDEIKGDGESTALKKKGTGTANDHQTSTLKKKKQEEPMRDDISDFEKPVVYEERQEVTTNEGPSNSTLKKKLTTQNNRQSTITNNNSTTNGNDKNGLRDSVSDFERPIADDNLVPTAVEEVKSSSTTAVAGKKAVAANSNLKTVNKPALKKSTTSLKSVSKPTGKDTQQPASKSSLSTTKNTKTAKGKPELVAAKKPVGVAKSGEELNDETRTAAGGAKKAALPKRPAASQSTGGKLPPKREAKTNKKGGDAHDHESSLPSKGISYEIKIDELEVGSSMEGATKTTTAAANTAEEESGDVDEKIHVNEDLGVVDDMLPKSKAGSKITETVVEADSVVKVASIDANNLSTVTAVDPFSEINESVESFLKSEVDISTDDETTLMMETARKTLEDALKTFEKAIAQRDMKHVKFVEKLRKQTELMDARSRLLRQEEEDALFQLYGPSSDIQAVFYDKRLGVFFYPQTVGSPDTLVNSSLDERHRQKSQFEGGGGAALLNGKVMHDTSNSYSSYLKGKYPDLAESLSKGITPPPQEPPLPSNTIISQVGKPAKDTAGTKKKPGAAVAPTAAKTKRTTTTRKSSATSNKKPPFKAATGVSTKQPGASKEKPTQQNQLQQQPQQYESQYYGGGGYDLPPGVMDIHQFQQYQLYMQYQQQMQMMQSYQQQPEYVAPIQNPSYFENSIQKTGAPSKAAPGGKKPSIGIVKKPTKLKR